jgi:hypothetical protein
VGEADRVTLDKWEAIVDKVGKMFIAKKIVQNSTHGD